jgi:hypothetical protein
MKTRTLKEENSLNGILEIIGIKLIDLRMKKGYKSHVDFAVDHKLPRIQYWRMEKGRANITIKSLNKVLAIHGLNIEEMFLQIVEETRKRNGTMG